MHVYFCCISHHISLSVCLLSICPSVCLSVRPSIHPSIYIYIYIYVCVCVCVCMCVCVCLMVTGVWWSIRRTVVCLFSLLSCYRRRTRHRLQVGHQLVKVTRPSYAVSATHLANCRGVMVAAVFQTHWDNSLFPIYYYNTCLSRYHTIVYGSCTWKLLTHGPVYFTNLDPFQ